MSETEFVIENVPLERLAPDPGNPRTMTESQAHKLMESLKRFGAVEPAVFNRVTGELVGGHMRVNAARILGWESYPTVFVDLSRDEQRTLNLALNRIAGEWDEDALAEVLWQLKENGADLSLSGFEEEELEALLRSVGPDEDPEAPPTSFRIIVECRDEVHQAEVLQRLAGEGLSVRPM